MGNLWEFVTKLQKDFSKINEILFLPDECPKCKHRHFDDKWGELECAARCSGDPKAIAKVKQDMKDESVRMTARFDAMDLECPFKFGDIVRETTTGKTGKVTGWQRQEEEGYGETPDYMIKVIFDSDDTSDPFAETFLAHEEVLSSDLTLVKSASEEDISDLEKTWDVDNTDVPNESMEHKK